MTVTFERFYAPRYLLSQHLWASGLYRGAIALLTTDEYLARNSQGLCSSPKCFSHHTVCSLSIYFPEPSFPLHLCPL